ncbi:hypothetical protein GCM10010425_74060 [Streptomyces spororaveus]|uniref:Uncharacterized protein n=1 Tax=Streptomyces spororaveus TaxID=284039 RepID=A0ABQ3TQB7_9ACTN|nr:hypothetical protein Sspor_81800 [Streptomyces spororaveus]
MQGRRGSFGSDRLSPFPGGRTRTSPSLVITEDEDGSMEGSHQVIMNGPSYRPSKRPKNPTDRPAKPTIT